MFYLLKSNEYTNEGFIESYSIGFENGKKFIKQKNKRDLKGLYSSCPEKYIDELKVFYFDKAPNEILSYKQIATNYPIIFRVNEIEKIGFASGVINAIDLMAIENPILFENFYLQIKPPYSENIELHKNSASNFFMENCINKKNEDGTINKLYYGKILTDNYTSLKNEIETNEAYKNYKNEALEFLVKEKSLILKTIKFLISCSENKNTTNIQLQWYKIEDQIKSIKNTINVIERFKINNDYVKALELKDFIKYRLNTVISYFESFTIYLNKTPIEALINDLISDFNNCIDINEINQIEALKNQPQQVESVKTDEVIKKLRNDIFKGNAIELFKYYYDCKSMVNNSRVQFRFLFEVMKEDGFIHDTVTLGQYIKFITKDFGYVDAELKSINLNSKPNIINLKDYNRYKEDLKTTLK